MTSFPPGDDNTVEAAVCRMVTNRGSEAEGPPESPRLIEDCLPTLPSSPSKKTSSTKRKQYYINRAIRNSDLTPKAKGRKSLRRLENNRYLMSLLERDECVAAAADEVDSCICASPSIFAEACNNEIYIEIWNDFMNRSGEEQEKVLAYLEQEVRKPREKMNKCKDKRTEHPAYSPEECYQRINRSLRCTLRRRQIPMGTLEVLEEEMLSFFSVTPASVYIALMENRFQFGRQTSDARGKSEPRVLPSGITAFLLPPDEMLTPASH
ncbi:R3H domain-containing protein 4 isoform X2 [Eleutherodactylus coqui]|uniref:R3H domain-containing protein 4 isoform X2 n=1 Tax=Eleutherodactylus coqui TaxID=57060 RepID=UPI0034621EEF